MHRSGIRALALAFIVAVATVRPAEAADGFPDWSIPLTFTSGADVSTAPALWSGALDAAVLRRFGNDATSMIGPAAAVTRVRGEDKVAGGARVATRVVGVRDAGLYLNAEALVGKDTLPLSGGAILDIPVKQDGFLHVGFWVTRDTRQHDTSLRFAIGTDIFRWFWKP